MQEISQKYWKNWHNGGFMRKVTILIIISMIFLWGCGGAGYAKFTRMDAPKAPEKMMEKIQNAGDRRD